LIKKKTEKIGVNPSYSALQILSKIIGSNLDLAVNLFNTIPTGISFTTDITCREIRHNQKSAEFFRIKPWESLSCTASNDLDVKLFHRGKELSPEEMPIQRAAWKAEYVKDFEIEFRWDDGVYKKSIWNSSPLLDESGSTIGAVASFEDITYLKKAEEALRLSEELFFKAFNLNPLPMAITSIKNDELIEVNEAFLQRGGFTKQELIGNRTADLGIWVDAKDRRKLFEEFKKEGHVRNFEANLSQKPGEMATFLFSGNVIIWKGEKCVLGVGNDITELRRYQKEIERLDRLNLVGEMSAGISHEIRNPMTTVRGFLQLLKEKDRYAQDKEYMDLMIDELDRANSIITEFLSLAKNKVVEMKKQSLNQKIRSIYPLLQADALKQGKSIKLELGDIPYVIIDKNEIHQLIHNLIRNGLEAMPPGGLLTVKTSREDDGVVLAVKDKGRGITPENLEKIGTPFFTTKDSGTGLGLAVCYSIAARHKARIGIETGTEGTTFFVRFKV
jgi:PAS domain S-box-containing protein